MATKKAALGVMLEMGKIDEPDGVIRMVIDQYAINELAESIAELGQLQAILVRPKGDRFEIVFGHRRFLAHQRLGKARIMGMIQELDDVQVALMRATENIERVDLSFIEEAAIYRDLHNNHKMSPVDIGKKMGKSPGIVQRRMDLLTMPSALQQALHNKEIGLSVAELLWSLGDQNAIDYYLPFAIEHGATLEVVRVWVKDHKDDARRKHSETVGVGFFTNPMDVAPLYVACSLCKAATEIGKETVLRTCPACTASLAKAMELKE